jgi:hypothetical protein
LNKRHLVHDNVCLVLFSTEDVRSIVVTVDYTTKECGCAMCGEFAAVSGQRLDDDFKLVGLFNEYLPHDIQDAHLKPAVLYCNACFAEHGEWLRKEYNVLPEDSTEAA